MNNVSYVHASITRHDGTTLFGGLTQVEIVVIGSVFAIALLGVVAVVLRVTMPRLKQKRKERNLQKKPIVDEKNG